MSDILVIFGYHKRYWLVYSISVGILASALTFASWHTPLLLVLCLVGINFEMAIVDLLTESRYAEKMQEFPESGSDIMTFVSALQSIGSIIALSFVGVVADEKLFWVLFVITTILAVSPLLPAFLGWLPEEYDESSRGKCVYVDTDIFTQYKSIFIVIGFTGVAGPILAITVSYTSAGPALVCGVFLLCGIVVGSYVALPRVIAHVAMFQILSQLSKPSMSTALDFFFTAQPNCLVDGPHFTFKYYITYTGLVSSCMASVATWIYQVWFGKLRFRVVLIITTCLVSLGGLSDLLIVLRVNEKMGIPDHVFYIMGESILESTVTMLYWISTSIIISKVCPRGIESAIYAFLAGASNFAGMISELSGALIFHTAGVRKCNFDNLWWLVLCFHIITPLIIGIPIVWLIPNIHQNSIMFQPDPVRMLIRERDDNLLTIFSSEDDSLDFEGTFSGVDEM